MVLALQLLFGAQNENLQRKKKSERRCVYYLFGVVFVLRFSPRIYFQKGRFCDECVAWEQFLSSFKEKHKNP